MKLDIDILPSLLGVGIGRIPWCIYILFAHLARFWLIDRGEIMAWVWAVRFI